MHCTSTTTAYFLRCGLMTERGVAVAQEAEQSSSSLKMDGSIPSLCSLHVEDVSECV